MPTPASFTDTDFPADPYPGARPGCSFVELGGSGWRLSPAATASGWRVGAECLDDWLAAQHAEPLSQRLPVLAYGSNACPGKITWLRAELGLTGPAVVLAARCTGLSAVWAAGVRARDGQRPAVLVAAPEVVEQHAIWLVTPEQRRVLDACEGRDVRYRLVRLHGPERIELEDGSRATDVLAYAAKGEIRRPLLVDGATVRCAELDQTGARHLVGEPGTGDGLDCTEVTGEPCSRDAESGG